MHIYVGGDHGGFALKQELLETLRAQGRECTDLGAFALDKADDYPDFALAVANRVAENADSRGIVVCGSGVGAAIAANKVKGVRAAMCHDTYSAHQGVEHDAMNVLCLGGRVVGSALGAEIVESFLGAEFSGEERHLRRLEKILALER